ncbi:MAG TPA: capsule assembly Wzi family protein, partial [Longimicrobiales bacterium]|nr:capsule assembly Wzi family protein [Longimicrobiales bacterium]
RLLERGGDVPPRVTEALERLARRFEPAGSPAGRGPRFARLRRGLLDMAGADSPGRPLRTGADGSLDAALNPLLQLNQGREIGDGYTLAVEAEVALGAGPVAGEVRPRAWLSTQRGPGWGDASATLVDAYVRTVVGPVSAELGRNHATLGHGVEGGPMLSNNARGLDMFRLSADRPVHLPGPFRHLGLWQASALVSDLGDNRDVPGSVMTILRLSSRPNRFVELGVSVLNIQGGEGSPDATFGRRLRDALFPWSDAGVVQISDKVAGADVAISLPPLRTRLYANVITTDDRGRFQQPAGGLWEDAVWLVGSRVMGVGPGGRFDAHVQWRHAGARAHTHHQFTSGVTLDGRVIGDALGPNAAGVSGGVDWTGAASRISVTGSWERYSGDDFAWGLVYSPAHMREVTDWFLVADNPDEIRKRLVVGWTRLDGFGAVQPSVRAGYERVTRFDYGTTGRSNVVLQASVAYVW